MLCTSQLSSPTTRQYFTPLHVAAALGDTTTVKLLIENGADAKVTWKKGVLSPLDLISLLVDIQEDSRYVLVSYCGSRFDSWEKGRKEEREREIRGGIVLVVMCVCVGGGGLVVLLLTRSGCSSLAMRRKAKLLKETKATMLTTRLAVGRGRRKRASSSAGSEMTASRARASTDEFIRKYEEARSENDAA